jgi:hypothetical protein
MLFRTNNFQKGDRVYKHRGPDINSWQFFGTVVRVEQNFIGIRVDKQTIPGIAMVREDILIKEGFVVRID